MIRGTRASGGSRRRAAQFHFTPAHTSWLNQGELALSSFGRKYFRGRVRHSPDEFPGHIDRSIRHYNDTCAHRFDWSFTRGRFRHLRDRSGTSSTGHQEVSVSKRPNILFIMTDQEPTTTSGCYGNKVIRTPARDSMAENGMRFDNNYVAAYPCTPSRARRYS